MQKDITDPKEYSRIIFIIIAGGFLIRCIYLFLIAPHILGSESMYMHGDTDSFTLPFINLWEKGTYTFNATVKEAAYGRLPGYVLIYAPYYLLFGKAHSYEAIAVFQLLLDTLTIFLIYKIALRLSGNVITGCITSTLYAFFPIIILWIPQICTELVSTFWIILWYYYLLYFKNSKYYALGTGVIVILSFFTREYLGILLPISIIHHFFNTENKSLKYRIAQTFYIIIGFSSIYIWWPVRNYIQYDKLVLIRPESAGYYNFSYDMVGYYKFYHCWSNDDILWEQKLFSDSVDIFPASVFTSVEDKEYATQLLYKFRNCGNAYLYMKYNKVPDYINNRCDDSIYHGFLYLRDKYIQAKPFDYWTSVSLQNFKKAFFKSSMRLHQHGPYRNLIKIILMQRTIIILLGFFGLAFFYKNKDLLPVTLYALFQYIYICIFYRSLEMRYLLQADVLLIIPTGMLCYIFYKKITFLFRNKFYHS